MSMGELSTNIYATEYMPSVPTVCATCGKVFNRYQEWAYKTKKLVSEEMVEGKKVYVYEWEYYDKWSCQPDDGLLYDDAKIRRQQEESKQRREAKQYPNGKPAKVYKTSEAHRKQCLDNYYRKLTRKKLEEERKWSLREKQKV